MTAGGLEIFIDATPAITGYLVEKGSVTVDGISLTATGIENDSFKVFIIPETRERTTLGGKRAGGEVNLEVDYLAKLIKKFLNRPGESKTSLYPITERKINNFGGADPLARSSTTWLWQQ